MAINIHVREKNPAHVFVEEGGHCDCSEGKKDTGKWLCRSHPIMRLRSPGQSDEVNSSSGRVYIRLPLVALIGPVRVKCTLISIYSQRKHQILTTTCFDSNIQCILNIKI